MSACTKRYRTKRVLPLITLCYILVLALCVCASPSPSGDSYNISTRTFCKGKQSTCDELNCNIKFIALQLSGRILPGCARGQRAVCDVQTDRVAAALAMSEACNLKQTSYRVGQLGEQEHTVQETIRGSPSNTLFVSPNGLDSNSGASRSVPMRTIGAALIKTRSGPSFSNTQTIVLMPGKHRVYRTIVLTPQDSSITFQGETGAIVTGAIQLNVEWTRSGSIFSADLPDDLVDRLGPLSVLSHGDDELAIRAQHPNKKSFLDQQFLKPSVVKRWITKPTASPSLESTQVFVPVTDQVRRFRFFSYTSNGSCAGVFQPPTGYFCRPQADADGGCDYSIPGAVELSGAGQSELNIKQWTNRSTGYMHVLHPLKWGGWSFKIGENDEPACKRIPKVNFQTLCLAEGGFQEARGDCRLGGGSLYVENIRDLLDSPGEFFLDITMKKLFYYPPEKGLDPSNLEIGSTVQRLFSVEGSSNNIVRNVRFFNIQFERTYPTHMEPHETPSGGDWAVHRGGALFLENISGAIVADCHFRLLGSNGLFVSKFARDVQIVRNNFVALDGSAILLVGDPLYDYPRPWDRREDTNYVAGVVVRNNIISDIGLRELQAAGIFGSIATDVQIKHNVVFNGPRAAIVFNDLFMGKLDTIGNILFNMVMLTYDHGPYNVWDRQKWILPGTSLGNVNQVRGNFIIGSRNGPKLVDLDDGARNHVVEDNVLAYGRMKFKGFNHTASRNVVLAYIQGQRACVDVILGDVPAAPRYAWTNNTCFTNSARRALYYMQDAQYCSTDQFFTADNKYLGFRKSVAIGKCGSIDAWQDTRKQDAGSTISAAFPSWTAIFNICKETLMKWY